MDAAADLTAWLRLLLSPGVGRDLARRLLAAFGSAEAVFDASPAALKPFTTAAQLASLRRVPDDLAERVAATQDWLAAGTARHCITVGDADFPQILLQTEDPPLLLFAQGRLEVLQHPALAVVGSRNPTPQGIENARAFADHLGASGWCIVSGLALGIDAAAHAGGLAHAGSTIAVVGTGLDRVYPSRHRDLAHAIATHGLLLSEFAIGTPPLRENFPRRNRVIAGLSRGTLVVEAALKSGSLITARHALEAGREVFAIPGSIHSPLARGCHALIKQGARLVESAADILDELGGSGAAAAPALRPEQPAPVPADAQGGAEGGAHARLLGHMGHDPVTLDALLARSGESASTLNAQLLELELAGAVCRLAGGLFQRVARA